jgi:hypothetical protein
VDQFLHKCLEDVSDRVFGCDMHLPVMFGSKPDDRTVRVWHLLPSHQRPGVDGA